MLIKAENNFIIGETEKIKFYFPLASLSGNLKLLAVVETALRARKEMCSNTRRRSRYATRAYLDWNEISIMQMRGCMECVTVRGAELSIRSLVASRATHSFI